MDVKEALEMLSEYQQGWAAIYEEAAEDLRFAAGDTQWEAADLVERGSRPCLTINVLPQFVHQVTNAIRQSTPSINILPADSAASPQVADARKGLIRNIEYRSGADEVYDTAADYAVTCSIGFIRVDHDYVAQDSWDQELLIKREPNPLACWIDPASIECDGSDAEGAIRLEQWSKARFEEEYPDAAFVSFEKGATLDDKRESITLAEIYRKEYEIVQKVRGENGEMLDYNPARDFDKKKRSLRKPIIKRYLFSGHEKLEEKIFPGEYIPLIPVYGHERWVDGRRRLSSLIRNAKDPQRRYNYWASIEAEILAKAPIAPFMAEAGTIEDFAEDWQNPHKAMVLRYKGASLSGGNANKPERVQPITVYTGIINAMQGAYEDIKRAIGLYDASVGQKSNETSGIAIENRKEQGNTATFHFQDNLERSIAHVGRVLNCAMPAVYDGRRVVQIIGAQEQPEMVGINGQVVDGQDVTLDLKAGKYDVRVTTGLSYISKRQEEAAKLGELIGARPDLLGIFGDYWAESLDMPNAEAIAARIRKTIPPQLLDGEDGAQPAPVDTQAQQQMQAMAQQMEAAQAEIARLQAEAQGKEAEMLLKQQELEVKAEAERSKAENERFKLEIDAQRLELERQRMEREALASVASNERVMEALAGMAQQLSALTGGTAPVSQV